jgi:hypothetical protein
MTRTLTKPRPHGHAIVEYLIAMAGLGVIWLAFERSPAGLGQAISELVASYSFLLSIPW